MLSMFGAAAFRRGSTAVVRSFLPATTTLYGTIPIFQVVRTKMTKRKKYLIAKKKRKAALAAKGIFPNKPQFYIDRKTPVVNAIPREERLEKYRQADLKASAELQQRMKEITAENASMMRYDVQGLKMSDKVRQLFELTNGSQKEIVKAQKQRGMKLFQVRDGDTGTPSVQVIAVTTRIQQLQTHIKVHKKDHSTKRGLMALMVRRRKLLDYMERRDFDSYRKIVKALGLVR